MSNPSKINPALVAAHISPRDTAQLRVAYEAAQAAVRALAPLVGDTTPDTDGSAQGRALDVLSRLRLEDAPSAQWTLHDERRLSLPSAESTALHGHLMAGTDDELRRGLSAWQRIIGAGPVTSVSVGDTLQLYITGSYEGLSVGMVTVVDADGAPEAVAA